MVNTSILSSVYKVLDIDHFGVHTCPLNGITVKKYFQDLLSQKVFFCQINLNHLFS